MGAEGLAQFLGGSANDTKPDNGTATPEDSTSLEDKEVVDTEETLESDDDLEEVEDVDDDDDDEPETPTLSPDILELKGMVSELVKSQVQAKSKTDTTDEGDQDDIPVYQFFSDEEAEKLFEDRDISMLNTAMSRSMHATQQQVLSALPQIMRKQVPAMVQEMLTVERFYDRNPDLLDHRQHLALHAEKVQRENPGLSANELLDKAAKSFRKAFGMPEPNKQGSKEKPKTPESSGQAAKKKRKPKTQADGVGGKAGGPNKSEPKSTEGASKHIDSMLDYVRGTRK